MVYGIETVVVDLGLCLVFGLQELCRRLHLVRLGRGVSRQAGHLLPTLHLWQTFCVALPADPPSFPQHIQLLILQRPGLVLATEYGGPTRQIVFTLPFFISILWRFRNQDELLTDLGCSRGHVLVACSGGRERR